MSNIYNALLQDEHRICIPAKLRQKYGFQKGDRLEFEEKEDGILIKHYHSQSMKQEQSLWDKLKAYDNKLDKLDKKWDKKFKNAMRGNP